MTSQVMTSQVMTSQAMTSHVMTPRAITSQVMTPQAMTSQAMTPQVMTHGFKEKNGWRCRARARMVLKITKETVYHCYTVALVKRLPSLM